MDANDVPSVFAHGDADGVVPYDCNGFQNNPSFDQLCGGGALINNFQGLNLTSDLLTFPGDNHCPWDSDGSKMNQVINFVSDFVYQNIDCEDQNSKLNDFITMKNDIISQYDLLGRNIKDNYNGIIFSVYKNGNVTKRYVVK